MAYADANTSTRKLTTTVAVVALEAGLVWALITGLAYTRTIVEERVVEGIPIPSPTPTILPPPPSPQPTAQAPRVVPDPRFTLGPAPSPGPTVDPSPTTPAGGETGTAPEPQRTVEPSPSPKPLFQPKAAKPKGDSSRWLSTDDYPLRSIRERQEGRTGYRLTIDASGRITGCTVTSSSGHPELDQATCKLMPRRAKFDAARDDSGAPVAGSFSGNVQWRLPPEE